MLTNFLPGLWFTPALGAKAGRNGDPLDAFGNSPKYYCCYYFSGLTLEAAGRWLMASSWALRGSALDYFLPLTDTACFHICPSPASDLSHAVGLKHIQESPQIFGVACASAGGRGAEASPGSSW